MTYLQQRPLGSAAATMDPRLSGAMLVPMMPSHAAATAHGAPWNYYGENGADKYMSAEGGAEAAGMTQPMGQMEQQSHMGNASDQMQPEAPLWQQWEWYLLDNISKRLSEVALRKDYVQFAVDCIQELKNTLQKLGPEWRVRAFGGFVNGLCITGSDLDATCFREGMEKTPAAIQELTEDLLPLLRAHEHFEITEEIWTARVPILKLRFNKVLDVDLSCHNVEPLPNTQLLRAYVNLHVVVKQLCLAVKLWSKAADVCGAKNGNLSSYSFTLMVIYFLQVDPKSNFPCLPTRHFTGKSKIPAEVQDNVKWTTNESVVALLYRFFRFYATEFQWGNEVIAIRIGRRTHRTDALHSELRGSWVERMHIADPFLLERNLNCVLDENDRRRETALYEQILEAMHILDSGMCPYGLSAESSSSTAQIHQAPAATMAHGMDGPPMGMPGAHMDAAAAPYTPMEGGAAWDATQGHGKGGGDDMTNKEFTAGAKASMPGYPKAVAAHPTGGMRTPLFHPPKSMAPPMAHMQSMQSMAAAKAALAQQQKAKAEVMAKHLAAQHMKANAKVQKSAVLQKAVLQKAGTLDKGGVKGSPKLMSGAAPPPLKGESAGASAAQPPGKGQSKEAGEQPAKSARGSGMRPPEPWELPTTSLVQGLCSL